jgi:alpha-D-ribose 1-methylphosphonate 5-triphosphate synthase subunit PhnG
MAGIRRPFPRRVIGIHVIKLKRCFTTLDLMTNCLPDANDNSRMLHIVEAPPGDRDAGGVATSDRQAWIALLSRAPLALLETALGSHAHESPDWLRPPETGLVMVHGRAGGTGDRFNLGEATVTRCALRLGAGPVGVAYVLGRSHRQAHLAATADALLQDPARRPALDARLLAPVRRHLEKLRAQRRARATVKNSTRVDAARESGADDGEAA